MGNACTAARTDGEAVTTRILTGKNDFGRGAYLVTLFFVVLYFSAGVAYLSNNGGYNSDILTAPHYDVYWNFPSYGNFSSGGWITSNKDVNGKVTVYIPGKCIGLLLGLAVLYGASTLLNMWTKIEGEQNHQMVMATALSLGHLVVWSSVVTDLLRVFANATGVNTWALSGCIVAQVCLYYVSEIDRFEIRNADVAIEELERQISDAGLQRKNEDTEALKKINELKSGFNVFNTIVPFLTFIVAMYLTCVVVITSLAYPFYVNRTNGTTGLVYNKSNNIPWEYVFVFSAFVVDQSYQLFLVFINSINKAIPSKDPSCAQIMFGGVIRPTISHVLLAFLTIVYVFAPAALIAQGGLL